MSVSDVIKGLLAMSGKKQAELTSVLGMSSNQAVNNKIRKNSWFASDLLNWSFIQAGFCDELSIVIAPAADGSRETQTLFMTKDNLTTDLAKGFKLLEVMPLEGSSVWLRYKV